MKMASNLRNDLGKLETLKTEVSLSALFHRYREAHMKSHEDN